MVALGLALAALIGLSLGMMGGGGSILTVPIFVYVLGFGAKQAIAMSFPVVGGTSAVGAIGHWRGGNVDLRAAALFGSVAMLGSYLGGMLAVHLTGATQLVLLALAMLGAAWSMARPRLEKPGERERGTRHVGLLVLVGLGVGMLTGVVGIGGGFLYVPALVVLARVPIKRAVGTSLVVIAMTCVAGLLSHLRHESIPWAFVGIFTAVAIGGILLGTRLVRFISPVQLRRSFAAFLVVMGMLILFENRGRFRPGGEGGGRDARAAGAAGTQVDEARARGAPPR